MAVSQSVPAQVDVAAPQAASSPFARPPRTYLGEVITRLRRNRTARAGIASLNTASGGLLGVFIVLFLTHWLTVCRLVRAQVMSVKEREFVLAARATGAGRPRLMRIHLLPHVLAPVLVAITFGIPGSISLEASLSFLAI